MTADISARRGALAIKNQHRLTTVKWLNGFELFKGSRTATRPKQRPGASLPTLKLADRIRTTHFLPASSQTLPAFSQSSLSL